MSQRPTRVQVLRTSGLDQGIINSSPEAGKGSTSEQSNSKPEKKKKKMEFNYQRKVEEREWLFKKQMIATNSRDVKVRRYSLKVLETKNCHD